MEKRVKKSSKSCLIIAILLIVFPILLIIGAIFLITLFSTEKSSESDVTSEEELGTKAGDVLSGIGLEEIKSKYKSQLEISESKSNEYLASLAGEKVIWIGTSSTVRADWINGKQYMVVSFTEKLIDTNLAYINVDQKPEYQKIPDMTLIKVTGTIDRIELFMEAGINVYFEDAIIEIVE